MERGKQTYLKIQTSECDGWITSYNAIKRFKVTLIKYVFLVLRGIISLCLYEVPQIVCVVGEIYP